MRAYTLKNLGKVDSTIAQMKLYLPSQEAQDLFKAHQVVALMADSQSSGVGKYGRSWSSPKGNLYLTGALKTLPGYSLASFKDLNLFNLLVAYTLHEIIAAYLGPEAHCGCKWPNDIVCSQGKLAGLLLERLELEQDSYLLFSVGVNIQHAPLIPAAATYKAAAVHLINPHLNLTPLKLAEEFLSKLVSNAKHMSHSQILHAWVGAAANLDQPVTVQMGPDLKKGIFRGIDANGNMVLEEEGGSLTFLAAGEVYSFG